MSLIRPPNTMSSLEHPVVLRVIPNTDDLKTEYFSADSIQSDDGFKATADFKFRDITNKVDVFPRRGRLKVAGGKERHRNHFVATTPIRSPYAFEFDGRHNDLVKTWSKIVGGRDEIVVKKRLEGGLKEDLMTLDGYTWGTEVHRIVSAQRYIRHDLFGMRLQLPMSSNDPWVAIEVINTHHPDEECLQAMLNLSSRVPFVALFVNIDRASALLEEVHAKTGQQGLGHVELETAFYISDGQLHGYGIPTPARRRPDYDAVWAAVKSTWKRSPLLR